MPVTLFLLKAATSFVHKPSLSLPLLMGALFVAMPLAGCVQEEDPAADRQEGTDDGRREPYVEGIGPGFLVLMNPIDASGCRNVEVVVEVPEEDAAALLPDGFEPAVGPVTGLNAALVLEVHACASSLSEEAEGGYSRAWLSVLVEPPRLPEPAVVYERENRTRPEDADERIDLYVVAAYVDGTGFKRFLRQSGIAFREAWFDFEGVALPGDIESVHLRVEEREGSQEALRLAGAGSSGTASTQHRTAWAVSRHGVQAFEEYHAASGDKKVERYAGTGFCMSFEEGLFADALPQSGCMANRVTISSTFTVTGHSFWFRDTKVLE